MLSIYWGRTEDSYYYIDDEFELLFKREWFDDSSVLEIIREIDNCQYIGAGCRDIKHPDIEFSVFELSTGSKGLILLLKLEYDTIRIWGTAFGDNCCKWLLKIAETRDITLELEHFMQFPEDDFKGYSLLQKRAYTDYSDYADEVMRWGYKSWCCIGGMDHDID